MYVDETQVVDATKTKEAGPQAVPRETDRVFVVLTDATGTPTGQIWQYTLGQLRTRILFPVLYLTAAPTSATAGGEGQQAFVTHDDVVDIYAFEAGAWTLKIEGLQRKGATSALPKPAPNTFADYQDTQAGGSVRVVPAAGFAAKDYKYAVGAASPYQDVPLDGIVTVGNVTASVYTYLPGTAARQQSDTAVSAKFTEYVVSTPGNTTPAAPTFDNFNDTDNTIILVPTPGVPMGEYRYKIGGSGPDMVPPNDGILNVGNVTAQVFAYSIAVAGRNQSLTAASQGFTATVVATVPGKPTSLVATATQGTTPSSIKVTGKAPASNGGSPIRDFNVYRDGGGTAHASFANPGGPDLEFTDFNATVGVPHFYEFTAINDNGEGGRSVQSNTATPTAPVSYDITLTGPSENNPPTGTTLTASPGDTLRYSTFAVNDTTPKRMDISMGGQFVAAVDMPASAVGKDFEFTLAGGTPAKGVFADGTVTL